MDRAYLSGAAGSPPLAPETPSIGYPTIGNPSTSMPATKPGPYWFHMVTEELIGVINAADMTPDFKDLTQLAMAIKHLVNAASPTGSVIYMASQTPPPGYLKADGAAVSRTTYAKLFEAIGTTFGGGDGNSTFNLPDLRGEFIRGWDSSRGIDSGRVLGSLQTDDLKAHTHLVAYGNLNFPISSSGATGTSLAYASYESSTFSTGGTETRPRNIALLACIKY